MMKKDPNKISHFFAILTTQEFTDLSSCFTSLDQKDMISAVEWAYTLAEKEHCERLLQKDKLSIDELKLRAHYGKTYKGHSWGIEGFSKNAVMQTRCEPPQPLVCQIRVASQNLGTLALHCIGRV
eukprot:CAMPEP_0176462994 /NCGR_PEP_ID=MMETSP0127-20121128/35604_1 /TAXON_ID=938130 /ORGANISM="Platyophrya macrostoma, Strain WH" /LENGTH=124 /DNA_ID=CAMNT_0017855029 /DNA_START=727 /DNA_END=1101 /DNA_ORIENTATION=-